MFTFLTFRNLLAVGIPLHFDHFLENGVVLLGSLGHGLVELHAVLGMLKDYFVVEVDDRIQTIGHILESCRHDASMPLHLFELHIGNGTGCPDLGFREGSLGPHQGRSRFTLFLTNHTSEECITCGNLSHRGDG